MSMQLCEDELRCRSLDLEKNAIFSYAVLLFIYLFYLHWSKGVCIVVQAFMTL